jgi:hypothetical protein
MLTPDAPDAQYKPYAFSNGETHLISVLPDGTAAPGPSFPGQFNGSASYGFDHTLDRAVSEDGSMVFWTSDSGKVYVRENPTQPQSAISGGECTEAAKACTIAVSESVTTARSRFWTASTDGSKVLFEVEQNPHPLDRNLYELDLETEAPTLIAGEVDGVVGASEDLSYIYFVSREALDTGATAGEPNLYLDREGTIEFIATVSVTDLGTYDSYAPRVAAADPVGRTSPSCRPRA